jgi:hypothetical protein
VVSEVAWLTPDVPDEIYDFFRHEYPGMTDIPSNLRRIEACGYEIVGHFTLPDAAWWTHYYDPLAEQLSAKREAYALDPQALRFIDESAREQQLRRQYGDTYGYEFFVTRLLDPDAPGGA